MTPTPNKRKKEPPVPAKAAKVPRRPKAALRQEVAEVYRRAILDAAERVFGAHGFAEAKMTQIAEGAGLAAGSLYNYFTNKEEIFRALVEHRSGAFLQALNETALGDDNLEHALVALVRSTYRELDAHGAFFASLMQGAGMGATAHKGCGPMFERNHQRFLSAFESVFRRAASKGQLAPGYTPEEFSAVLAGAAHGVAVAWIQSGRRTKIEERAQQVVRLFLNGAMKR